MNPELPQVRPAQEAMPQIPGGVEYFPDGGKRSPETAPGYERQPAPVEQAPVAPPVAPVVVPTPAVPVVTPASSAAQDDSIVSDAPVVAADDDLIEKEWVDKAKSIIALTKGNPYEQAKAIAALQADYLKKRHNREIGEDKELV